MAYFDNDFDNLFNELNSSFFNDDFGSRRNSKGSSGSIPINYSSSMGAAPQTIQQNPQQPNEKPIGVDLVEEAKNNKFDPVIGRDEQIDNVIEILSRRKKNNPVLIGPAGVGKTSIVEGLAERIASGNVPAKMANMHIISVNINDMVAGSSLRGSFEERLKKVIDKAKSDPNIVLFIDEIHNIVGAGSTDSENNNGDAANILKPALASGQLKLIGATTTSEFQRIEKDPALSRRFHAVQVPEPTTKVAVKILEGLKKKYEDYHHVKYSDDSLKLAVELSERYIQGRYLPDKAIDLMDEAGAKKALLVQPTDEKSLKNQISALEAKKTEAAKAEDYDKASEIKSKIAELENQRFYFWKSKKKEEVQKIIKNLKVNYTNDELQHTNNIKNISNKLDQGMDFEFEINELRRTNDLSGMPSLAELIPDIEHKDIAATPKEEYISTLLKEMEIMTKEKESVKHELDATNALILKSQQSNRENQSDLTSTLLADEQLINDDPQEENDMEL